MLQGRQLGPKLEVAVAGEKKSQMLAADDRDGVLDSDLDSREASSSSVGFLL
jgi:hypothetical protein